MKQSIISKFTIPGFHYWPDAPDEYAYLRNQHRHLFYFKIEVEVNDSNREIEFIDFGTKVKTSIYRNQEYKIHKHMNSHLDFRNKSCEQLCKDTYNVMHNDDDLFKQAYHLIKISVFEDNENGASIYF